MWNLRTARIALIVGGSLAAAYTQLSTSPATVAFLRSLGGNGFHIGILGALPVGVLFMQLAAAFAVNGIRTRKPLFMTVAILQRLVLVPAALGPWFYPEVSGSVWVTVLLGAMALNQMLTHFAHPLWLSWMGDYLPHRGLSRYWGVREWWMQGTAAVSLLVAALLFLKSGLELTAAFAVLIVLGAVCGVGDILLFFKIEEPPLLHGPRPSAWSLLKLPFEQREFCSFIRFSCLYNVAAMIGAPFISIYLLEHLGLDLFQVMLLWMGSWIGGAAFSRHLGRFAEKYGQRPLLMFCAFFKTALMAALLLTPAGNPTLAFWGLLPVLMVDSVLNTGVTIANTGFMIKNSPREFRTMFLAAGNAFAGMAGGLAAVLAGLCLTRLEGWTLDWGSLRIVPLHLMFAASLALRICAAFMARTLHEPKSVGTRLILAQFLEAVSGRSRRGTPQRPRQTAA